jgi:hypothetical protein
MWLYELIVRILAILRNILISENIKANHAVSENERHYDTIGIVCVHD